jgi:hypothetical protein
MLDLVQGDRTIHTGASRLKIDETNYDQRAGVRGGRNEFEAALEEVADHPLVTEIELLPGTGVYRTRLAPARLVVHAPTKVVATIGQRLVVHVQVADTGDNARRVKLIAQFDRARLKPDSRTVEKLGTVTRRRGIEVAFGFSPKQAGPTRVRFFARGANAGNVASTALDVRSRQNGG